MILIQLLVSLFLRKTPAQNAQHQRCSLLSTKNNDTTHFPFTIHPLLYTKPCPFSFLLLHSLSHTLPHSSTSFTKLTAHYQLSAAPSPHCPHNPKAPQSQPLIAIPHLLLLHRCLAVGVRLLGAAVKTVDWLVVVLGFWDGRLF